MCARAVCVCVEGVGVGVGVLGFVDIYGAWQVEKGESESRNIKKNFSFSPPKEDMREKHGANWNITKTTNY